MQCPSCYTEVPYNAKFCLECGASIEQSVIAYQPQNDPMGGYNSMGSMAIPGEIRQCAHCDGSSICKHGSQYYGYACKVCLSRNGLDTMSELTGIVCAVCGGKGSVWLGPNS